MSTFIAGDNFDRPGGEAESIVFNKMKEAFSESDALAYSRYPLFMNIGQRRKEPDFILLDDKVGFIVIEVKGYRIDNIDKIEANRWILNKMYEREANPLGQVEDYVYAFKGRFDMSQAVRRKYKIKGIIALPYIEEREFDLKNKVARFDKNYILFKDDLTKGKIIKKLCIENYVQDGSVFNRKIFKYMQSLLGHEDIYIEDKDVGLRKGEKKAIINKVKEELMEIDLKQETIGKSIAPGPQRIRGIAGSGKTMMICQKAVNMHLKNPNYKIVITFFTQSLYEIIRETVDMYMRNFTQGIEGYSENSNLKIMHAWGGKKNNGLYKDIVEKNGLSFLTYGKIKERMKNGVSPDATINCISLKALEECNGNLKEEYDAIFIDEGQDLIGSDEYKYEGKQSFYYMAYLSLKKEKRLVWAYDELQSLNDTKIPTGKELFGNSNLVKGSYKGGIKKSEIMKKCYRIPHEVLTVAHAIGMGMFRKEGLLTGYTTKKDWENIGYEVLDGDFRKIGSEIRLKRNIENSPNPIKKYYKENVINFKKYSNEGSMINDMARMIKYDIEEEGLEPSKDILIINLKQGYNNTEMRNLICDRLLKNNINFYIPKEAGMNTRNTKWERQKADKFWCENAVTVSTIERAKGNEGYYVYILGIEDIAKNEDEISLRNKLFTAMTRTKGWINMLCVGNYSLYEEIEKAIESNGDFKFIYKRPKRNSDDLEG